MTARLLSRAADVAFGAGIARCGWSRAIVIMLFVLVPGFWWTQTVGFFEVGFLSERAYLPLFAVSAVHPIVAAVFFLRAGRGEPSSRPDPPGLPWIVISACLAGLLLLGSLCVWPPPEIFR